MPSDASYRAARRLRSVLSLFLVFASLLGAAACSDDDDPSGPGGDIAGTWTAETEDGTLYLEITESTVATYQDVGECFVSQQLDIVGRDDDVYTVEDPTTGFTLDVQIRRSGDNLVVNGQTWEPSNADVDDFEVCGPIELPACSTLPEIGFGTGSELGDLEETDPVDEFGAHYDLFRVTVDSEMPDPVVVEMNSTEFDTYLFVYDDSGDLVAENDDFDDSTTDSRVDLSVAEGCYIVVATSFFIGETGQYQVWFY